MRVCWTLISRICEEAKYCRPIQNNTSFTVTSDCLLSKTGYHKGKMCPSPAQCHISKTLEPSWAVQTFLPLSTVDRHRFHASQRFLCRTCLVFCCQYHFRELTLFLFAVRIISWYDCTRMQFWNPRANHESLHAFKRFKLRNDPSFFGAAVWKTDICHRVLGGAGMRHYRLNDCLMEG